MLDEKETRELLALLEKLRELFRFDEVGKEKPFFFLADNMSYDYHQLKPVERSYYDS